MDKLRFKDAPCLIILSKPFPALSLVPLSTERFGGSRKASRRVFAVGLPWSCPWNQCTADCGSCWRVTETKWVFFPLSFSLSSFLKPDNFLQLTWDLILTSWSFTCFDILEIKMSVRLTPNRVWSDITQTLPKQWLALPVCFLLKEDLKEGFSFESLHLRRGQGGPWRPDPCPALPRARCRSPSPPRSLHLWNKHPGPFLEGCLLCAHLLLNSQPLLSLSSIFLR